MTYLKGGTEYLDEQEMRIWHAVKRLNEQHRTTNNSQIAAYSGYSRSTIGSVTAHLRRRGFLRDVSKGAAYHWRLTSKAAETERP
jgi:DNA-binding IclR family transcriptional regulator